MTRVPGAGAPAHKLVVEYRSPNDLKPYPRNSRQHSVKQIRRIEESMRTFGFNCPVLIGDDDEIIAGHARVKAAQRLGLTLIPTIRMPKMSPVERRGFILADNRIAEMATWDREVLAIELQEIIDSGAFEVEVTGFTLAEIDVRLDEAKEKKEPAPGPEEALPTLQKVAVTRRGDVWVLGLHRLICGDATSAADYEHLMIGKVAALVVADPPFNRPTRTFSGRGRTRHPDFVQGAGEMSEDEFIAFLGSFLEQNMNVLADGSILFVCMDWQHIGALITAGRQHDLTLKNLIVWVKTSAGMGSFYRGQHELVAVFKHGDAPHTNTFELGQHGRNRSNVWTYPGGGAFRVGRKNDLAMHPTVKPVAMIADAIRDVTRRSAIVLDPFAGSGSTIIAAERTGRICYAIELDPRYCDVIVRRWQQYSGKLAQLEGSGTPFDDVEVERSSQTPETLESEKSAAPAAATRTLRRAQ